MAFSTFKPTFANDLGLEVIDIYVGPERKRYVVHKKLLTDKSDYFYKAFNGSFVEAEENSIHLKEEDPAAVSLLIGWLYLGVIPGTMNFATPFATKPSPPFLDTTVQIPISEQGTLYPPTAPPTRDGNIFGIRDVFQHVCCHSHYLIFSPEELRLADYKLSRKYSDLPVPFPAPTTVAAPPPVAAPTQQGAGLLGQHYVTQPASQQSQVGNRHGEVGANASPSAQQATSEGLFNLGQPSSTPTQGGDNLGGLATSHFAQPGPLHPGNSHGSGTGTQANPPISNIFGTVTSSQTASINSTVRPTSNIFGVVPPNQPQSLFGGSNNSSSHASGNGLFSGSTYLSTSNNNMHPGSNNPPSNTPTGQALPTFSRSSAPPSSGIFGGQLTHPQQLSGFHAPLLSRNNPSGSGGIGHYFIYGPNANLPPGAAMISFRPQKPKTPSDFGYYPLVKHIKSPLTFIDGIPQGDPSDEQFIDMEKQQLALLNLCIMAETLCWPALFNEAISAYIQCEHRLQRSISLEFIDRIYIRTHLDSTLRAYVLDSLSRIKADGVEDLTPYINMARKHEDFLADLLGKVLGSNRPFKEVNEKTIENYRMYGMGSDNESKNYDSEEDSDNSEGEIK